MYSFYQRLLEEESTLKKQIRILKDRLADSPSGYLEVSHSNGMVQYYYRDLSGPQNKRRYIRKKDRILAEKLAQRDYDIKLLKELEARYRVIAKARKVYEKTAPQKIGKELIKERQDLITPMIISDEEFIRQWQSKEYERKPFPQNAPEIYTVNGERVRSKSEKIIADTLLRYGVPYQYERPVFLEGFGLVHPDFHVLNTNTRQEWIWEHFGMMDDETYVRNAIRKIDAYEKNNILPGMDLIITSESKTLPLNMKVIDNIISRLLN